MATKRIIKKPLVSVVMPVFNAEKYLSTSIESILKQTYRKFEFIIIHDASTDKSLRIIREYAKKDKRIKVLINRKNLGVTRSLNKGVKAATGKYIIRMDADDWSYPSRFENQVKLMESNPKVVVSGSFIEVCDQKLNVQYQRKYQLRDKAIRQRIFRYSPFAHPATIWKTELLKQELYSDFAKNSEDYELYFRIGQHGKFMNINKVLLKLRMHQKSISSSMNDTQSKMTIIIRKLAAEKYGYKMSITDKLYNLLQERLISVLPIQLRFAIFNFLRKFEFY